MSKKLGVFLGIITFVLVAGVNSVSAQVANTADVVKRMQEISEQMQTLQTEFAALTKQLQGTPTPTVLGAQTSTPNTDLAPVFTEDLSPGVTNDDIKKIQRLLAADLEIYPYGVASGFFGPKTVEAINNLQVRFGYDPVGVIGPATKALLEGWIRAYPNENYPEGVLTSRPTAIISGGGSESSQLLARLQSQLASLTNQGGSVDEDEEEDTSVPRGVLDDNPAKSIEVSFSGNTATVEIEYNDSDEYDDEKFSVKASSIQSVAQELEFLTFLSRAEIDDLIVEVQSGSSRGGDKGDADDAIDAADEAIADADDEIDDARRDDEDTEYARDLLDEAEDLLRDAEDEYDDKNYDRAIVKAEEAEEMAKDAEDAIGKEKRTARDIDVIEVEITDDNEAEVKVEYDDGDDERFDLDEDDREELIQEIADELDIDEDDVEDLIEFDYGDIDSITAEVNRNDTDVTIEFESGVEASFEIDETDEDDIIDEIAKLYDLRTRDIEDVIDFD